MYADLVLFRLVYGVWRITRM